MSSPERPLRFAIIGCGRIGGRHALQIARVGELAAVCDVVPERADALAEEHGVPAFYDYQSLLADGHGADVISICTPNGLHAEHTVAALRAGYHVLCEKPMALTVTDCGRMIHEAERANRRLFIVKQNRFNPPVEAVKRALDEGRLGRILSIQLSCFWNRNPAYYEDTWKGSRALDGGTLYTQFSHFIDLVYWLAGDVRRATAFSDNFVHEGQIEFEDTAVVALEFHSGALGTMHFTINSYDRNMEGSITLFCERGTVKIGGQYLNELEYQNIEGYEITGLPPGNPPNQYGQYQGSMSNHDKVYENVVDVLTRQGVIATNGYEGLKTVEIIDKIYLASDTARAQSTRALQPLYSA